jgi:predicted RNA-binding protein (TIGR00451 family)
MVREEVEKLRSIADYQFTVGAGETLFPANVEVKKSRRTGRMRYIYYRGMLLASLKPETGNLTLTIEGFRRLIKRFKPSRFRVKVKNEAADSVAKGLSVFAKHVEEADINIRPGDEVAIVDEKDVLLAVGRAVLSGIEMVKFNFGVAVKNRRGKISEEK